MSANPHNLIWLMPALGSIMLVSIVGFIATVTSIISLPPQLYRTYKTKSAKDLSLCMLINFLLCSLSWVAYGFLTHTTSVWITNIIMSIFSIIMIVMKITYDRKELA